MRFKTVAQVDVPQGHNGKHKQIVFVILRDLDKLDRDAALKVPLSEFTGIQRKDSIRAQSRHAKDGAER